MQNTKNQMLLVLCFGKEMFIDKVTLSDISIINKIDIGDTIVTGGMSAYFPEGIPIGKVIEIENDGRYYSINVKLFNNMTNLR